VTLYLALFAIVIGINLMPAFAPPTWTILVFFTLSLGAAPLPVILIGAGAAACGRYLLGTGFRRLGDRLPERTRANLAAAGRAIERSRRNAIVALFLFAVSPVPSAQLFEAAGLAGLGLARFTAAFFIGRAFSYAVYVLTAAHVRDTSLGDSFRHALTSPVGIAIQLGMIALLVLFARIDWAKRLGAKEDEPGA
jgi:membrane protein YqaA with SNARE-associated domain